MNPPGRWLVHGLITETFMPVILVDKKLYKQNRTFLTTEEQANELYDYIKTYSVNFLASKPSIDTSSNYTNIIPVAEIEIF